MSFEISPDFKIAECQDFCNRVADGTHDSPKEATVGKRLVTSKNVKSGRLELDSAYLISTEDFESINKRSKVDQWDLLLTMIGTVGEVCLVTESEPDFAIKNVGLLKCGEELKAKWLYYFLRSPQGQKLIEERKKGSTQQYVSLTELRKLPISYPEDPSVMRRIVEDLTSIDDRITLLRETNTTLEAIAQALFKSWFVDFDPVHAKMQGRAPEGMIEATAALFPDSFEESELGAVPKGWRFSSLGKSFELTMGQSPPGDTYNQSEDGLPFYQGRTDFGFRFPTKRIYCNAPTRLAEIGDALVSVRAPVGDVNMAIERCCIGRGIASVRHQSGCVGYTLYAMKNLGAYFKNFDTEGTIFGSINKKDFEALPVVVPSQGVLVAFDEISKALDGSIEINEQKIRGLVEIRDTLLPRLISGQLQLPEVGQFSESLA
jgi:type I restriction enzyme S subunit